MTSNKAKKVTSRVRINALSFLAFPYCMDISPSHSPSPWTGTEFASGRLTKHSNIYYDLLS